MKTNYLTITGEARGEFKDRGSKFLAFAFPFQNPKELKSILLRIKKDHLKARHHCFAFRCGADGAHFRFYDDGEPSGTAGKPILRAIDKFELTNTLVVVVRYFGGTKLGTSGLIKAYHTSSLDALNATSLVKKEIMVDYSIKVNYEKSARLIGLLNQLPCKILSMDFGSEAMINASVPIQSAAQFIIRVKAEIGNLYPTEVTEKTEIPGLEIKQLIPKSS